jgi:hypothetical protein
MKKMRINKIYNFALLAIFASLFLTASAQAATYTVNSILDPGVVAGCDATECTLREAIAAANATTDDDEINFDASLIGQTITLNGTQLTIADNGTLTLNGLGASQLSVSGDKASRVFNISSGADVTINNLTISDGNVAND